MMWEMMRRFSSDGYYEHKGDNEYKCPATNSDILLYVHVDTNKQIIRGRNCLIQVITSGSSGQEVPILYFSDVSCVSAPWISMLNDVQQVVHCRKCQKKNVYRKVNNNFDEKSTKSWHLEDPLLMQLKTTTFPELLEIRHHF